MEGIEVRALGTHAWQASALLGAAGLGWALHGSARPGEAWMNGELMVVGVVRLHSSSRQARRGAVWRSTAGHG